MKLVRTKGSRPVDLTDWGFDFDGIAAAIKKEMAEAIDASLNDDEDGVKASWWPSPDDEDFTKIEISLPFDNGDFSCTFNLSVRDLIADDLWTIESPDKATKARDAFLQIAAAIHKAYIPSADFPDVLTVEIPDAFREAAKLEDFWGWDTYISAGKVIEKLTENLDKTNDAIAKMRHRKMLIETALIHYSAKPTQQTSSDS
jgi:hypothetical protein